MLREKRYGTAIDKRRPGPFHRVDEADPGHKANGGESDTRLAQSEGERSEHEKQRQPRTESEEKHPDAGPCQIDPQILHELRETPARHAFFPVISARLLIHFHSPGFRSTGSVSAPNWIRVSVSTRFPAAATIRFTW